MRGLAKKCPLRTERALNFHFAGNGLLLFYFPAYAVLAVFDDDMHRFELVADRVGCRPILIGACLGTLCNQLIDFCDVKVSRRGGLRFCV